MTHPLPIPCHLPIPYNPLPCTIYQFVCTLLTDIRIFLSKCEFGQWSAEAAKFNLFSWGKGLGFCRSHGKGFRVCRSHGRGFRVCRSHRKGHMAKGLGFRSHWKGIDLQIKGTLSQYFLYSKGVWK